MARSYLYVSVGVEYTGTELGRDSILTMCAYTVNAYPSDECVYRYVLPLSGAVASLSRELLAEHGLTQEYLQKYGTDPAELSRGLADWIHDLCGSQYEPVLVVADPIAEQFVRWYLVRFAGQDMFGSESSRTMSARINRHLRKLHDGHQNTSSQRTAVAQRDRLIQLLDVLDLTAGS